MRLLLQQSYENFTSNPSSSLYPQHLYHFPRFGYHYTIMCLASWPLLIWLSMARCHGHDRAAVESDIKDGLYSRAVYIIVMVSCNQLGYNDITI